MMLRNEHPTLTPYNPRQMRSFRGLPFCAYLCADLPQWHYLALEGQSFHTRWNVSRFGSIQKQALNVGVRGTGC